MPKRRDVGVYFGVSASGVTAASGGGNLACVWMCMKIKSFLLSET